MLQVQGLRKSYGTQPALAGIDLEIKQGEILGLLGPNGAGKSTLVSLVAGLLEPDAGEIRIDGIDAVRERDSVRHLVGVAGQETGLYPVLTAEENLVYFGGIAGLRRDELRAQVREVVEMLDLGALLSRKAGRLSGGEQRRLHTGMALMGRPKLLLLDEPTAGVDVATRQRLLEAVRRMADSGLSILYTTHYLPEVESLGAGVMIIDHGRVISHGLLEDLLRQAGEGIVEIRFRGEVPDPDGLDLGCSVQVDRSQSILRLAAAEHAVVVAALLGQLPPADAARVEAIEILQPSLETVFLSVTGRRYQAEESDVREEVPDS